MTDLRNFVKKRIAEGKEKEASEKSDLAKMFAKKEQDPPKNLSELKKLIKSEEEQKQFEALKRNYDFSKTRTGRFASSTQEFIKNAKRFGYSGALARRFYKNSQLLKPKRKVSPQELQRLKLQLKIARASRASRYGARPSQFQQRFSRPNVPPILDPDDAVNPRFQELHQQIHGGDDAVAFQLENEINSVGGGVGMLGDRGAFGMESEVFNHGTFAIKNPSNSVSKEALFFANTQHINPVNNTEAQVWNFANVLSPKINRVSKNKFRVQPSLTQELENQVNFFGNILNPNLKKRFPI